MCTAAGVKGHSRSQYQYFNKIKCLNNFLSSIASVPEPFCFRAAPAPGLLAYFYINTGIKYLILITQDVDLNFKFSGTYMTNFVYQQMELESEPFGNHTGGVDPNHILT